MLKIDKPILKQCIECTEIFDWRYVTMNTIILNQQDVDFVRIKDDQIRNNTGII